MHDSASKMSSSLRIPVTRGKSWFLPCLAWIPLQQPCSSSERARINSRCETRSARTKPPEQTPERPFDHVVYVVLLSSCAAASVPNFGEAKQRSPGQPNECKLTPCTLSGSTCCFAVPHTARSPFPSLLSVLHLRSFLRTHAYAPS